MEEKKKEKVIDNYAIDCFRNCPKYYYWRIVRGLTKPFEKKTAADFGTAIHKGLEVYYKGGLTPQAQDDALVAFAKEFTTKENLEDDKRTVTKGLELLQKYFVQYGAEPFNVIDVEVGGAIELNEEWMYSFRIDLITEWHSPKGIYGFDHKTTSALERIVVKPNNQISGYDLVLKQYYENVVGFIINAIGVYKTNSRRDRDTGKLVERDVLLRYPTTRTPNEIKDWKAEVIQTLKYIDYCTVTKTWPRYTHFCSAFRGRCMFLDLCNSVSEDVVERMVQTEVYLIDPWKPYSTEDGGENGD